MLQRTRIRDTIAAIVTNKLPNDALVKTGRNIDLSGSSAEVVVKIYLNQGFVDNETETLLPGTLHDLRVAYMRRGLVDDDQLDANGDPLRDAVLINETLNGLVSGIDYQGYSYPDDAQNEYSIIEYQFVVYEPYNED